MAYTSGFFDAVDQGGGDYDRVYSAASFAHYFSLLVKNGVFLNPTAALQVKASSSPDMHISVQPGSGWINGYYITVEDGTPEVLTVPTANPSLPRIDSVIMGLNYIDREIQLYIKSGAVSSNPVPASLQRDSDLYELELAQINVAAGAGSITQSNITDTRTDSFRCGIVAGAIDQIDATELFAQFTDEFNTWFADLQAQLSGDIATNLQNQINEMKNPDSSGSLQAQINLKVNTSDKASKSEAEGATNDSKWMTPAKVLSLLKAQKSTLEDIKYYAGLAFGSTSGTETVITPSLLSESSHSGLKSGENSNTLQYQYVLQGDSEDSVFCYSNSVAAMTGQSYKDGTCEYSSETTIQVGGIIFDSDTSDLFNEVNWVALFGKVLPNGTAIVITTVYTRTSGSGYSYRDESISSSKLTCRYM